MQLPWFRGLLSCFSVALVSGLLASHQSSPRRSFFALCSHGAANIQNVDGARPRIIENDFAIFINQCSIQNFLFLMVSLRDIDTAIWLEQNFTKPVLRERRKNKHGKDKVLQNMQSAFDRATQGGSKDEEIKLLSYHGLSAINTTLFPSWNSYFEALLEEQDVTIVKFEYEIDITPSSLCSRLISVREQIALEFARDLDRIIDISSSFIDDYHEFKANGQGNDQYRTNLLFLYQPMDGEPLPSPLRKGNFDLLMLFTLQESIHRVLNTAEDDADLTLLRNIYVEKRDSYFVGSVDYGRAEDFLVELLESSCSGHLQDEEVASVDPLRVVKLVLHTQATMAMELIEVALETPNEHLEIRRRQLQRLLQIET